MNEWLRRFWLAWFCGAWACATGALAEEADPAGDAPRPAAVGPRAVEELRPALYYLKDRDGKLQAVPGFEFEDFVEAYKQKNALAQPAARPPYSIQRIEATGVASADYADLTIQVTLRVDDTAWVRVPLRLNQAILSDLPRYEGPGESFVEFEENGAGHVAWIHGRAGEDHPLNLHVLVPLATQSNATRMKLAFPRAVLSELKLKVALADAVGQVPESATLLPSTAADAGTTQFAARGLGADFELSWRPAGVRASELPPQLESVGALLARIDGRNLDSEATLTVRSFAEPFDRLHVRLPRGAELVPQSPNGYTTVAAPAGQAEGTVEVRLHKKTVGPVTIKLAARRTYDPSKPDEWLELSGFEVVEAARQWGHIAVAIVGDWHVLWGPSRAVRRTDQWPDALRFEDVMAGFEYFAQPCSLTARLVPPKKHVSIEPEYLLLVDPDQVRLEARLKCSIRGAKAFALDVKLSDWELDQIEPEYLVAVDSAAVNAAGVLSIPLLQPTTGQVELVLRAHRPIPGNTKTLSLNLPQPQANSLEPAAVVILPADNVELTPQQTQAELTRQQVAPPMPLPERQQEPLYYRAETAKATFVCGFRVQPQQVSVSVSSQALVEAKTAQIEQKLTYNVAYEALDHVVLDVPRSIAGTEGLAVMVEGQPLRAVPPPGEAKDKPRSDVVRTWFPLPKAYLGTLDVVARYPLPLPGLSGEKATTLRLPLIMPALGKLTANRLNVTAAAGINVEPRSGAWSPVAEDLQRNLRRHTLQLEASDTASEAALQAAMQSKALERTTLIERAWVQTWLLPPDARQDRAVFRFLTNESPLELTLPAGVVQAQLAATLDGKPIVPQTAGSARLLIDLPADEGLRQHVLEVRYHLPEGQPRLGRLGIDLPHLGHDTWARRTYWQLVLPRYDHLLLPPAGLTAESSWGWSGMFWGRVPLLEQPQLESWAGGARMAAIPESTNRYLFSGAGPIGRYEFTVVSRTSIVLLASGVALLWGLLWIYLPGTRHPVCLLALALILAGLGLLDPDPALLLAEAASLGVALALLAALLARLAMSPAALPLETPQPVAGHAPTQTLQRAAFPNPPSTETAALVPPATLDWDL